MFFGLSVGVGLSSFLVFSLIKQMEPEINQMANKVFTKSSDEIQSDIASPATKSSRKRKAVAKKKAIAKSAGRRQFPQLRGKGSRMHEGAVIAESLSDHDMAFGVHHPHPQIAPEEKANREGYEKIDTNPYILVKSQPLSTFSVDVDTASYANMRRFLFRGQMPPKDSLRVEE